MIKNEEQFISFLSKNYDSINKLPSGWLGIGDDTAIVNINSDEIFYCADALVQDVHFRKNTSLYNVGWKAIVSNQSDIAAMGGKPLAFTITLGINNQVSEKGLSDLYKGMDSACKKFGGYLVGGDVVKSKDFFISVSAIGKRFIKDKTLQRDSAKSGDVVAVTGEIGNSIAGFELLENNSNISNKQTKKFLEPVPKIIEGKLAIEEGIICGMDISDGLHKDLNRICESSNVKIEINVEKIPYDKFLEAYFKDDFYNKIITSGEEYELILIAPISKIKSLGKKIDISIIGKVTDNKNPEIVFYKNNKKINLTSESFDHFG